MKTKKTKTEIKYLNVGDKTIPYIILNKDNKNTYFRFREEYLEVSKSKYVKEEYIVNYLKNNFDSFYQRYLKVVRNIPKKNEIVLEDKSYQLVINESKSFTYRIDQDQIIVNTKIKDLEKIKKKIYQQHLENMVKEIENDVNEILVKNNIKPLPIRYGYYKSKFGSYHRFNKEVTLNIVLAKTNIKYLYYVMMHEYAHTKHFDHSKNFYKVLKDLMPDYIYYHKSIKKLSIWI